MPDPGTVNNAEGVNSWTGFANEEPYGQKTQDKALADAAPLTVGKVAVGALNAPKRAQRKAVRGQQEPRAQFSAAPAEAAVSVPQAPDPAATWQEIAATPGAERYPLLNYYAGVR